MAINNNNMTGCRYPKNVFNASKYEFKILKPSKNKKLGKVVTKGRHKDKRIYTLHLEVRNTCSQNCFHWDNCYDDNMPFAHRFKFDDTLLTKIWRDLEVLDKKHKQGFLVRLHIGGDFPSVDYVNFWEMALLTFPNLSCYGYTHHHYNRKSKVVRQIGIPVDEEKSIGKAIRKLRNKMWDRFSIRFSDLLTDELSANSNDLSNEGIVCPEQTKQVASCGECTLCWNKNVSSVLFITH
jgi:hypothetical protein|tara:strand:+ start:1140 stop:1850 length:711 start_codon:yes stop_codon:yes gene_type:complete